MHIILYHMHIIFLYPQYTSQCTPLSAPLPSASACTVCARRAGHTACTGHAQDMHRAWSMHRVHSSFILPVDGYIP